MIIKFNFGKYKYDYYNNNLELHRLGGPCFETNNGKKYWCQNNLLHREDGPAIEHPEQIKQYYKYYLNSQPLSEAEYWKTIRFKGFL